MSPTVVILVIAVYFALLFTLSWFSSRGGTNQTFFTGGRRNPWPLVAIAMIGASISGVTFISVPGMVVGKSYSYLQMVLGFVVGYMLISVVLLPLFYKRNLSSIYGYLDERFGVLTHRTGAWFFFVSKMLGASVRFFVVCAVLQMLVFGPLGIPFYLNVIASVGLIGLYTMMGGVKSLIFTDLLNSFCLVGSVVLCIAYISGSLGLDFGGVVRAVADHPSSRIFMFDDPKSGLYFWKQFVAGIFLSIACNGLDQDLMQRNLGCKGSRSAQKNLMLMALLQIGVIVLFLSLGTLMVMYVEHHPGLEIPEKTDDLFGMVATSEEMPWIVGLLFVVGLISASYTNAGSALTAMTTSFTIDILRREHADERKLTRTRKVVHLSMTAAMALVIVVFYYLAQEDAISAVYTLASYTYGPLLGLFALGLLSKRVVDDRMVPVACVSAPVLSWALKWWLHMRYGYELGFELLLVNAAFTILLSLIPLPGRRRGDVAEIS